MNYWKHSKGVYEVVQLIREYKIIPIIGAGFTKGESSDHGKEEVPDGNKTIRLMKDLIISTEKLTEDDMNDDSFPDVATIFFQVVPTEKRIEFFKKYFTGVKLCEVKKRFVELKWPCIYTINIDDAIENTDEDFHIILPYKKIRNNYKQYKRVYKLHGDAEQEISYDSDKNIVFRNREYVNAITDENNRDILNNLIANMAQKNIIYIGCSLKNEDDLIYATNETKKIQKGVTDISSYRILVRDCTLKKKDEIKFEADFLINTVILVDSYDSFYRDVVDEIMMNTGEEEIDYKFDPKIIKADSKSDAMEYLSGKNIYFPENNEFKLYSVRVERTCVGDIYRALEKYNCVFLCGRRFSGKSTVLSYICINPKYKIFYFPSTVSPDVQVVQKILSEEKKSILIFDSNSMTETVHSYLSNEEINLILENNCNKIIVAGNSEDNYLTSKIKSCIIKVSSTFDTKEIEKFNIQADKYAFLRRKKIETNFDYIKRIDKEQRLDLPLFKGGAYSEKQLMSKNDILIIILLCAVDKIYFSDLVALNIPFKEVKDLINRMPMLIEKTKVDKDLEAHVPSSYKIVHNSKVVLLSILHELSDREIINGIYYIVKKLKNDRDRHRLYKEVMLFDTLNQMFHNKRGAGNLIFRIYEELEKILNDNPHFWLQRAKSIYRLKSKDESELKKAYMYAQKAYRDGNSSLQDKAALSLSIICMDLFYIKKNEEDEEQAIEFFFRVIMSWKSDLTKCVSSEGEKSLRRIKQISNEYITNHSDMNTKLIEMAKDIIEFSVEK